MDRKNSAVIRQSFGNVVYTQKIHEICAEKENRNNCYIKIANIALPGLILLALIIQILQKNNPLWIYIGVGLTIGEIIFFIVQLSFNFGDAALQHKKTALILLNIRDKYIGLIADIMNEIMGMDEIINQRNELLNNLNVIYNFAPQTTRKAYKKAQKRLNPRGIVEGEDFTFSDEEIDRFLPKELRISNLSSIGN